MVRGHTNRVNAVEFFNDARRVVTGSADRTIRIWEVQKGASVEGSFEGHQGSIFAVAVSPRIARSGEDTTIIIWDVESMREVFGPLVKHTGGVQSACFSPDGKRPTSGSYDCTVIVWNTEDGTILTTHDVHRGWVWRIDNAELLLNINAHRSWVIESRPIAEERHTSRTLRLPDQLKCSQSNKCLTILRFRLPTG